MASRWGRGQAASGATIRREWTTHHAWGGYLPAQAQEQKNDSSPDKDSRSGVRALVKNGSSPGAGRAAPELSATVFHVKQWANAAAYQTVLRRFVQRPSSAQPSWALPCPALLCSALPCSALHSSSPRQRAAPLFSTRDYTEPPHESPVPENGSGRQRIAGGRPSALHATEPQDGTALPY